MIKVNKGEIDMVGDEVTITAEIGIIYNAILTHLGEAQAERTFKNAVASIKEHREKETKREIEKQLKKNFPKKLAESLINLL